MATPNEYWLDKEYVDLAALTLEDLNKHLTGYTITIDRMAKVFRVPSRVDGKEIGAYVQVLLFVPKETK